MLENKKPGFPGVPLTEEEKRFIDTHYGQQGWSDNAIAKKLGKSKLTIFRYRKKVREALERTKTKEEKNIGNALIYKDLELFKRHKAEFIKTARYKRIAEDSFFSQKDLDYFIEVWCRYKIQFKDMTATEEDSLEKMIILDIRILYNQKSMRNCQKTQEQLQEQLNSEGRKLDVKDDKDLQIIHTVEMCNTQEIELNKQYALLIKEYKEIQKTLNATREQREQNQKIGAETFFDLVKKFQSEEVRAKVGRYNELVRLSKEEKFKEFQQPHKYVDGAYDLPILDGATIKKAKLNEEKTNNPE